MELSWILYLLPFIAALIGWMTNFLAVKMLFHPKEPKKILGFSFHGVFPKRQSALAEKLGNLVSEELFSASDVSAKIKDFATSEDAMEERERGWTRFLGYHGHEWEGDGTWETRGRYDHEADTCRDKA